MISIALYYGYISDPLYWEYYIVLYCGKHWYSHDVDGRYISSRGYMHFNGYNTIEVLYKDGTRNHWTNGGNDCCLPDSKIGNIYNVFALT